MRTVLCFIGGLVALPSAIVMVAQLCWLLDVGWLQTATTSDRVQFSLLTLAAAIAIYGGLKCFDAARRL